MPYRELPSGLWLDGTEYAHLKNLCTATGLTKSTVLRKLIAGIQLRPRPPGEYTRLLRELSAIGNNIHQIAYWANVQKSVHEGEIGDAAVLAKRAWELVKNGL